MILKIHIMFQMQVILLFLESSAEKYRLKPDSTKFKQTNNAICSFLKIQYLFTFKFVDLNNEKVECL